MSIEPFFRDELYLRDDLPDTRKDVITVRPGDDLDAVDTPPTYAMGLAERLAALHLSHHTDAQPSSVQIDLCIEELDEPFDLTAVTLDDHDSNEVLDDFDPDAQFDRETLPSAPYPTAILDDGATAPSWDVLPQSAPSIPNSTDLPWEPSSDAPASAETRSPVEPSLWGKLQRFVTGISSKPLSQPPVSSSSFRRLSQRALFELVWTCDNAALDALSSHIDRILAIRRLGPEAYAESRIVDMLDNMLAVERGAPDGICISILRSRIPEVARPMFDHALLRLENRGIVTLLTDDIRHNGNQSGNQNGNQDANQDGIWDPVRGTLIRCVLLQHAD